jgi:hypothetical protein
MHQVCQLLHAAAKHELLVWAKQLLWRENQSLVRVAELPVAQRAMHPLGRTLQCPFALIRRPPDELLVRRIESPLLHESERRRARFEQCASRSRRQELPGHLTR